MQLCRFTNGGYCLHKIEGYWKGRASAWYDREGRLLDCEQVLAPFGTSRRVKQGGPMWRALQAIGKRYQHIPTP